MPYSPAFDSGGDFLPLEKLSVSEKQAVELIKSALSSFGLPCDPLYFRYTDKYLAISGNKYHPFARLKLNKDVWYIALSCGDADTGKNFRRFDLSDVPEISKYSKEICEAFRFCDPQYVKHTYANVNGGDLSSDIQEFFCRLEVPESLSGPFVPTPAEVEFFSAYIEKLKSAGLNWRNVPLKISTDGVIVVRGGRVKLRKKANRISYFKSERGLSTEEKNLSLSECIERQKYWISHCLAYKETYNL